MKFAEAVLACGFVGMVSACSITTEGSLDASGGLPADAVIESGPRRGIEAEFDAIADQVPSFAGYYRDEQGAIVVRAVGQSEGAQALEAVIARLPAERRRAGVRLDAGAHYSIRELMSWRDDVRRGLKGSEWTVLDVDEAKNTIAIGVPTAKVIEEVLSRVIGLGVPKDAVVIHAEDPVPLAQDLDDNVRPLLGGLRIRVEGVYCTLGPIVRTGTTIRLMTNSHCTPVVGSVAGMFGGEMYQSDIGSIPFPKVGDEFLDPALFTGGACPVGFQCRYSDAALFKLYNIPVPTTSYEIARTSVEGTTGPGNITIGAKLPISVGVLFPTMGDSLKKTGGVSGTTRGAVIATCADYTAAGTTRKYLCQDKVDAYIASGDSGSPVWQDNGTSSQLFGMLWGGTSTYFVFSNMMNLENEVGPFDFN